MLKTMIHKAITHLGSRFCFSAKSKIRDDYGADFTKKLFYKKWLVATKKIILPQMAL